MCIRIISMIINMSLGFRSHFGSRAVCSALSFIHGLGLLGGEARGATLGTHRGCPAAPPPPLPAALSAAAAARAAAASARAAGHVQASAALVAAAATCDSADTGIKLADRASAGGRSHINEEVKDRWVEIWLVLTAQVEADEAGPRPRSQEPRGPASAFAC